ncbi:hypothetical protein [Amycolatopsis australiensis]|uniref:Uncharacterized protein n=1 Tax=Amycolatopsis australiensis TaxID=546364 RepID=A0A1K1T6H1_9PSEU|nr:hypothetical protein [Amycolatopsis australiensis]SFW92110.1 hypothetical protein SAMN04489730_8390 [Amycolatopsis australiensis]
MPLLPAVVPLTTEKRAERVPARLARNVAPLFGVPFAEGPFGEISWLCDFTRITVSEIARGAPSPTRAEAAETREQAADGGWFLYGRAVVARSLPNEIVNATTNRFGPNTKAAVVLTAANVLLEPATAAVETALSLIQGPDGELPTAVRIAVWATCLVEVFRSQPALVAAAAKARAIQRESLDGPRFPRAARLRDMPAARCEIGDTDVRPEPATHPRDLNVFDRTVARLRLPGAVVEPTGIDLDDDDAWTSPGRDLADELVDRLIRLLTDASEPDGTGYVWISERAPGQVVAEALLPASGLVADLLEYWSSVHGDVTEPRGTLPLRLPSPTEFAGLPQQARRAIVLGVLGVARWLRSRAGSPELPLSHFLAVLDAVDTLISAGLPDTDPAAAVVRARLAVLRVTVLRHDRANSLAEPLGALIARTEHCLTLLTDGILDRGAAADVLSAACVELNAVRWTNAEDAGSGLPAPAELDELVRRYWAGFGEILELDLASLDGDDSRGVGHHLHNYAAFLGSHQENVGDLTEAVRLFRTTVIPSRQRLHRRTGAFGPLGRTYYVATGATTKLAETALAEGRTEEASGWAALGFEWISRVLEHREFDRLQDGSGDQAGLFALRAAAALVLALELDVPGTGPRELGRLQRVLATIDRWQANTTRGRAENYVRHQEVELVRKRAAELMATR